MKRLSRLYKDYLKPWLKDSYIFPGALLLFGIYFLVVQPLFLLTGDTWAEAFPEYVNEAVTRGWLEIFRSSWAGYLTIIPSFLSKLYVTVGLPLGYIDYYMRAITVGFTIVCLGFIAHPINRRLIPNDMSRLVIAFALLLSLRHVSALAFINIWYVGFVPVILLSLGAVKLRRRWEIIYTIFAVLIALTKSSSILLPFVIYRTVKTKSYLSGSIIAIAVIFQTYLTVFAKNGYGSTGAEAHLLDVIRDVILGAGVSLFKVLHISPPGSATVLITSLALFGAGFYLLCKNFWQTTVLGVGLAFAIYLHVFAPDNGFGNLWTNYDSLYQDTFKLQREFLINFLLLIFIALFASRLLSKLKTSTKDRRMKSVLYTGLLLPLVLMNPLTKIDTNDPSTSTNIASYRHALNNGHTVCMPVPPTPLWDYRAVWFFQYKGGCYPKMPSRPFAESSFTIPVSSKGVAVSIPTTPQDDLRTVTFLVKKLPGGPAGKITLKDSTSNYLFHADIPSTRYPYAFVNFNVGGLGPRESSYEMVLSSQNEGPSYFLGTFSSTKDVVMYPYFVGYPNMQ